MKIEHHKPSPEAINLVLGKLQSLGPEQIFVVSSLIDFLQHQRKESEVSLSDSFTQLSSESLWKIWDNDEDAIYDTL